MQHPTPCTAKLQRYAGAGLRVSKSGSSSRRRAGCSRQRDARLKLKAKLDYSPSPGDMGSVLDLPPKESLHPAEITNVFDYPRDVRERFHIGEVLGSGSYGIVRRCVDKDTGEYYAMKSIPKTPRKRSATPRYLLKLRNEVDVMRQLGASLNAVYLESVYEDDENVYLIMELCTGGPLLDRMTKRKMTEKDVANLVRSILQFIAQCHAKGIMYRDVKTDNFLFLNETANSPLKATDFGLSIRHWPNEPKLKSRTGTPAYMAPEVVLQSYDEKADLWSVGMLCFQLLTGRFPFWKDIGKSSLKEVWSDVVNKNINLDGWEWKFSLSRNARAFLKKLLVRDPKKRLSAAEALKESWIMEGGTAECLPLEGSVVQRLQRFATYGDLKQLVLKKMSSHMKDGEAPIALALNQLQLAANHQTMSWGIVSNLPVKGPSSVYEELQQLFKKLDADRSGTISRDELSAGLKSQGYSLSDAEVQQLLEEIDVDKSGNIDFDEFMATLIDWSEMLHNENEWLPYLDSIFSGLDKDGDGSISLSELVEFIPPTAANTTEHDRIETAKRMIREADKNEDGVLSKDEFYEMMMSTVVPDPLSQYDRRLSRLSN